MLPLMFVPFRFLLIRFDV
uniref:Uncharacterized protein n=1 Tax=Anguilla anguilla TaxID=7936 RepID=A0A0E9UMS2_ANGAN